MSTDATAASVVATSTRDELIRAAVAVFATVGYEGASVRDIERRAGVSRGLVAHHFGTKDVLWRTAVDWLMQRFHDEMGRVADLLRDVSPAERGRVLLKVFVRFTSQHPELTRILMLSGTDRSARMRWLVDQYSRRNIAFFRRVSGMASTLGPTEAMMFYIVAGAAAYLFSVPAECEMLFGVSPTDPTFIDAYADAIAGWFSPERTEPLLLTPDSLRSLVESSLAAHNIDNTDNIDNIDNIEPVAVTVTQGRGSGRARSA